MDLTNEINYIKGLGIGIQNSEWIKESVLKYYNGPTPFIYSFDKGLKFRWETDDQYLWLNINTHYHTAKFMSQSDTYEEHLNLDNPSDWDRLHELLNFYEVSND